MDGYLKILKIHSLLPADSLLRKGSEGVGQGKQLLSSKGAKLPDNFGVKYRK